MNQALEFQNGKFKVHMVWWILGKMKKKKKKKRKWGGKETYWGVWLSGFVKRKLVESRYFLSRPAKMFFLQIWEKSKDKT